MSHSSILMFGWEYPPHNSGGLGVACLGMCEALVRQGHKLVFVLPENIPYDKGKVEIVFAENKNSIKLSSEEESMLYSLYNPYLNPSEYSSLQREYIAKYGDFAMSYLSLIEKVDLYSSLTNKLAEKYKDVDVIHAHDWLCFGAGIAAKKVTGKPLVVHVHATEFDRSGSDNVNIEIFKREKMGLEEADSIVTVSSFTKNIIIEKYGIDPDKINVVHNGVLQEKTTMEIEDLLLPIKKAGNKIVLSLGRITMQKGVDYFVKAAELVLKIRPNTYFIISGSGDMEKAIINLSADLGISKNILYTGFVRGKVVDMLYKSADVFVMPSVSEPFGIAPLEAIYQGTPVIISKQSGVSEVVSHALKVDFWDVGDLANKIIAVLDYPKLSQTLEKKAKEQVKSITWDKVATKLGIVYKNLNKK